jgi:hypothetical protein
LLYNPSSGRFDDWNLDQLFTTSFFPYALAAADLDADGRLDLAAASGRITSVLLADGRGGLSSQVGYPGSFLPSLQVFDVDGDGEPDLAAGGGSSVSLLFNRGQGRFGSGTEILMPGEISFFTAADVDGDGNPDLLAAGRDSGDVLVSLNNGNGTFIDLGVFRVVANASTLAAADLNGDGHPDLATAYWYSRGISVLLNAGDGTFGNPRTWDVGGFYGIAAADLDGDGDTDLATSRDVLAEGSLVFQNLGNAMFRNKRIYGVMGNQVLAADLNSDSYPDLVFGSIDLEMRQPAPVSPAFQMFSLLRNRGPGLTFAAPVFFQTGQATRAFAAGDFDGDGVLDLASGGQPDSTQPSLAGSVSQFLNRTPPPVSKDLDRDRIPDECAGRLFHRGDSNGDGAVDLSDAVTIIDFLFSAGAAPGCRESADADNDGGIDLSDPIGLLGFLFLAGPPPAPPGPAPPCGPDPDPPGSPHFIGCESYDPCPR